MNEVATGEKRVLSQISGSTNSQPILYRLEHHDVAPPRIHIDKDEFSVGRARENDEIILDTAISRKHCVFRCEGNKEWTIKDLSSTCTYVNDQPIESGGSMVLKVGDIVQFSTSREYRYEFTFDATGEHRSKRPRLEDSELYDTVLTEQKTFAETQETQKKVLKDQLETKQKEQEELKLQLEQLLEQQKSSMEDTESLKKQIGSLEAKIEMGNTQEQHLQNIYADLLKKLEEERLQFEAKLNEEKAKWEAALNMTKQEKETLQEKMKLDLEACRLELQTKWTNEMENRVKEEKNIQAQLLNEKTMLEQKLKEAEQALKEQEAKAEIALQSGAGPAGAPLNNYIVVEFVEDSDVQEMPVLDTIDLTNVPSPICEPQGQVLDKVSDIMDEQLTCSICSELFVKATTLNCTHTFCHHCISSWIKKRRECPVCRSRVGSMNRSLVLDNFIEKMLESLPTNLQDRRQELIKERQVLERKKKYH